MTLDAQLRQRREVEQAAADLPPLVFRPRRRVNTWALTWFLLAVAGWGLFFFTRFVIIGI